MIEGWDDGDIVGTVDGTFDGEMVGRDVGAKAQLGLIVSPVFTAVVVLNPPTSS